MRQSLPRKRSAGFTLTEILIVITVIAILAAMSIPAIMSALGRAHETAVVFEVMELDRSMEDFKNQYGFYPPSFESDVTSATELLPYVTRMSPNHAEWTPSGIPGRTRLQHWWEEVGQFLDQESSLVFWLSGVCKNKQYPITGSATAGPAFIGNWVVGTPPLAAHGFNFAVDGIERDGFFEFEVRQIIGNDSGEFVMDKFGNVLPNNQETFIVEYRQRYGSDNGEDFSSPDGTAGVTDYRFKYRNAVSYIHILPEGNAYYDGDSTTLGPFQFANPSRFQIISFGMDGLPGVPGGWNDINSGTVTVGTTDFYGPWGADNLTNFAEGRLEKWALENE